MNAQRHYQPPTLVRLAPTARPDVCISEVDLATAIVVTEVELAHVRRHGTVSQELQTLARLADLHLQIAAGEGRV